MAISFEVITDNLIGNGSLVRANCNVINTTALPLLKTLKQNRDKESYDTADKQLIDYVFQEVYLKVFADVVNSKIFKWAAYYSPMLIVSICVFNIFPYLVDFTLLPPLVPALLLTIESRSR